MTELLDELHDGTWRGKSPIEQRGEFPPIHTYVLTNERLNKRTSKRPNVRPIPPGLKPPRASAPQGPAPSTPRPSDPPPTGPGPSFYVFASIFSHDEVTLSNTKSIRQSVRPSVTTRPQVLRKRPSWTPNPQLFCCSIHLFGPYEREKAFMFNFEAAISFLRWYMGGASWLSEKLEEVKPSTSWIIRWCHHSN